MDGLLALLLAPVYLLLLIEPEQFIGRNCGTHRITEKSRRRTPAVSCQTEVDASDENRSRQSNPDKPNRRVPMKSASTYNESFFAANPTTKKVILVRRFTK
jgi:hypothetical protein